jgi:hypothetical protein
MLTYVIKPAKMNFVFRKLTLMFTQSVVPHWFGSSFPPLKFPSNPVNSHLPVTRCDDDDVCRTIIINTVFFLLAFLLRSVRCRIDTTCAF